MDIKNYTARKYLRQKGYKAFIPSTINHDWTWSDTRIHILLEEASQTLGKLDAFSLIVPDIDTFILLHVVTESQRSNRIEGTHTSLEEALQPINNIAPERRDDWQEIQNYITAMHEAIQALQTLPLSNRLLGNAHKTLMQGVRGQHKNPGEWRQSQNWIGGSSLQNAVFIPPPHVEIAGLMSDLEKFWHNEKIQVPHLIRIAINHYQIEMIHPFLDGNGRIGRLLITLYLIAHGFLQKPSLYLSAYFEKHREHYYDAFTYVRSTNDIGHWIRFFLYAVKETAHAGVQTFQAILRLRQNVDHKLSLLGQRAPNARRALNLLYQTPLLSVNALSEKLDVTHQTANRIVRELVDLGVLREITGFRRNRMFVFDDYLALFRDFPSR